MKRILIAALLITPLPALAAEQRLTPAEVEAAKEAGARANREAAMAAVPSAPDDATDTAAEDAPPPRRVHGEMGVEVGTGGYSSVYGTMVAPLGENGVVALSFENEQDRMRYRRLPRR